MERNTAGRTCHVDGAAGIAGDMALGALVDLGWPIDDLVEGLRTLPLEGWTIDALSVDASGLRATRVRVHAPEEPQPHRGFGAIRAIVEGSDLPAPVVDSAVAVFRRLCEAEATIHGVDLDAVHLHEVGAVDAILDVCGVVLGLHALGVERLTASPLALGAGTVRTSHGVLPVPAPATLELLRGLPTRGGSLPDGVEAELTTPTGAALLSTLCDAWGPAPPMTIDRVGHGAGTRTLPDRPNVVRFTLGREEAQDAEGRVVPLTVIECDVDDATPERLAEACRLALEAGARDVVQQPAIMKKSRLGTRFSVLADPGDAPRLTTLIMEATGSLGCRLHDVRRAECARDIVTVETRYGTIAVKRARWRGRLVSVKPEHDDCRAAARSTGATLRQVEAAAIEALRHREKHGEKHGESHRERDRETRHERDA